MRVTFRSVVRLQNRQASGINETTVAVADTDAGSVSHVADAASSGGRFSPVDRLRQKLNLRSPNRICRIFRNDPVVFVKEGFQLVQLRAADFRKSVGDKAALDRLVYCLTRGRRPGCPPAT